MGGIVIAAGGTGGHVYPALAVARELARLAPKASVSFVGGRGLEARVVPADGWRFASVSSGPWRRARPWTMARGALLALRGAVQARAVLRAERAAVVFSTGGFAAAPVLLAAAVSRIPIVLHEPNEVPGVVTRLFAPAAALVTTGGEGAAVRLGRRRTLVTGVPVRGSLLDGDRDSARRALDLPREAFVVLMLGGSQGAAAINRAAADALGYLGEGMGAAAVLWACGPGGEAGAARAAARSPVRVLVRPYLEDIGAAYRAADLVVSRAGASTVAELLALGLPSVLVPYPHAAADHQRHNADALARAGAALVLPEEVLDGRRLGELLRAVAEDRGRLAAMAERARSLGRPDAARMVAEAVLRAGGGAAC